MIYNKILLILIELIFGFEAMYIPVIDLVICDNPIICHHEEGHRLDFKSGRPSQTEEFKIAVDEQLPILLIDTSCKNEVDSCLYSEAFARLYAILAVGGRIPEVLMEFYGL